MSFAVAGITAGVAGALQVGSGLMQQSKAKKMRKGLVDPGYVKPAGYGENLGIAKNMAKTGMDAQQYNQAQTNIDRNVNRGASMLSRSGRASTGIAGVVRAGIEGKAGLDVASANIRRQNILTAMGARREVAQQDLAKQQYEQQGYMDKMNQANAMTGAGWQNISGGLNSIGSAGMTYASSKAKSKTSSAFGEQVVK